ncbi:hypothetical protein ACWEO2_19075, partial [Nocardia sp. NPDC004278]
AVSGVWISGRWLAVSGVCISGRWLAVSGVCISGRRLAVSGVWIPSGRLTVTGLCIPGVRLAIPGRGIPNGRLLSHRRRRITPTLLPLVGRRPTGRRLLPRPTTGRRILPLLTLGRPPDRRLRIPGPTLPRCAARRLLSHRRLLIPSSIAPRIIRLIAARRMLTRLDKSGRVAVLRVRT